MKKEEYAKLFGQEYYQSFVESKFTFKQAFEMQWNSNPPPKYGSDFINATPQELYDNFNPFLFMADNDTCIQFASVYGKSGLSINEINKQLADNKHLQGLGDAFLKAEHESGLNAIYLINHSILEIGDGLRQLTKGHKINN